MAWCGGGGDLKVGEDGGGVVWRVRVRGKLRVRGAGEVRPTGDAPTERNVLILNLTMELVMRVEQDDL